MQDVADWRGTKLTSLKVLPYTVLRNMMTRPRFSHSATKGIERERREKVTVVVPGVENGGGNAGVEERRVFCLGLNEWSVLRGDPSLRLKSGSGRDDPGGAGCAGFLFPVLGY